MLVSWCGARSRPCSLVEHGQATFGFLAVFLGVFVSLWLPSDARPERPQRAHRAVNSAARGTAGSAIALPASHSHARRDATALAVSQKVAKHASLPCARRAALVVIGLRAMEWHAPAEGLFLPVQDRGATCEL